MTNDETAPSIGTPKGVPSRHGAADRRKRKKIVILALLLALLLALAYSLWYFMQNRTLPLPRLASDVELLAPPEFLYNISGTGANALGRPVGVAIGPDGRVYVSDVETRRVTVFTREGRFLFHFNGLADGKNKSLRGPVHMAFNAKGELWVTDRTLDAVYVFTPEGRYVRKFTPADAKLAKAWSPLAVTFDTAGRVYISETGDTKKHRILVFEESGKKVAEWGKTAQVTLASEKPGEFYFPNGITVAPTGLVYVADGNNRRLQVFDPKGKFQQFMQVSGVPRGIWFDVANKRLVVSDALAHQVDIYDLKGQKLVTFGAGGKGPGQFQYPNDLTLDGNGRIYIADRENHQVQVWGWPQGAITLPKLGDIQRWGWCLTPLLLLPLLLLRRKREFAVTEDFVDAMVEAGDVREMARKRLRWVVPLDRHKAFEGRVEDGIDLGELIVGMEHSEADAKALADRLEVDMPTATILALSSRSKRLATEDPELRKLALLIDVDVYDRAEFMEVYGKAVIARP